MVSLTLIIFVWQSVNSMLEFLICIIYLITSNSFIILIIFQVNMFQIIKSVQHNKHYEYIIQKIVFLIFYMHFNLYEVFVQ